MVRVAAVWMMLALGACDPGPTSDDPVQADAHTLPWERGAAFDTRFEGQPNVLLVIADDAGVDKIGVYGEGASPPATPTIDALAQQGVMFTQAWANPWCSASRATLYTGRHAFRHGIGTFIFPTNTNFALPDDEVTLAEALAPSYTSALMGKWHLVGFHKRRDPASHPFRQGWAYHRGSLSNPKDVFGEVVLPRSYTYWQKSTEGVVDMHRTYMTIDTTDDAIEMVETLPEPWFLTVAYNAPHAPWGVPPAPLPGSHLDPEKASHPDAFDAMVEALDHEMGRLLASVPDEVWSRTVVVFLSDNGTPGPVVRPPLDPTRKKSTMYEGGVRVPLIVAGPPVVEPGRVSEARVGIVDLFPTLVELTGVPTPTAADGGELVLDGVSLVPWLEDPAHAANDRVLYSESFEPNGRDRRDWAAHRWAVRDGSWKLAEEPEGELQFFDLRGRSYDEGPNLLDQGPLSSEAEAAKKRLEAARDDVFAEAGVSAPVE